VGFVIGVGSFRHKKTAVGALSVSCVRSTCMSERNRRHVDMLLAMSMKWMGCPNHSIQHDTSEFPSESPIYH